MYGMYGMCINIKFQVEVALVARFVWRWTDLEMTYVPMTSSPRTVIYLDQTWYSGSSGFMPPFYQMDEQNLPFDRFTIFHRYPSSQ